ncbi:GNAT family N-acetyltransferase [Desulfogranum japonicum]|uniref:GNAT family N-acetyltransferase n=1 Tax=Desulfogranum japonicum TaxID=231447 RepID=UPI000402555E|nr:N-acetyltransferase [Desulfogranum japonicum]
MLHHRIRRAVSDDLLFLLDLEQQCFPEHRRSTRQGLKTSLKSHAQEVYILEQIHGSQPNPVGAVVLLKYKRTVRIFSLALFPQVQGLGLGSKLIQFTMDRAAAKGFERVSLEADSANSRLIQWYQHAGFHRIEHLPDYYAPGEDAFRMAKKVQAAEDMALPDDLLVQELPNGWTGSMGGTDNMQI